ncbi:MAG TPA: hypothetical protein VM692_05565 [Gammaproteobacteria bacterium]|nr:hypothetical protein [Gammaproteobacteria bacterium]
MRVGVLVAALTATAQPLAAQSPDAPRAPRIIPAPGAPAPATPTPAPATTTREPPLQLPEVTLPEGRRPPNAASLAPLPDERKGEPEEIIVIGQGWRLPDLGSEWRAKQKEAQREGGFSATALPLYDPAEPPLHSEAFTSREQRRHGYIELFRLRFGRRSRD